MSDPRSLIREPVPGRVLYESWLAEIDAIEAGTISLDADDRVSFDNSLNLGRPLFPLMETISWTLFEAGVRAYLAELGYDSEEADLLVTLFRNGNAHNNRAYRLAFSDGSIEWEVVSSAGSGGFRPYFPHEGGALEMVRREDTLLAILYIARLARQVRADLQARLERGGDEELGRIIGRRVERPMPAIARRVGV